MYKGIKRENVGGGRASLKALAIPKAQSKGLECSPVGSCTLLVNPAGVSIGNSQAIKEGRGVQMYEKGKGRKI